MSDTQLQNSSSATHVQTYSLMHASVTAEESDAPVVVDFSYAFDILDVAIGSEDYAGWSVKSLTLTGAEGTALTGTYSFDLTSGQLEFTDKLPAVTVRVSNAGALTAEEAFHVYAAINPIPAAGLPATATILLAKAEEEDIQLQGNVTLTPGSEEVASLTIDADTFEEVIIEDNSIDLSDPDGDGAIETANCYIVSAPGQTYRFPATVMGNGYTTPATADYAGAGKAEGITPTALAPQSAQLLWQTDHNLISDVKLRRDQVYFTLNGSATTPLVEGNAVIAVYSGKNGTGDILWSWHIWVTAADIDGNTQTYTLYEAYSAAGTTILMDRNLGALKAGMWGSNKDNLAMGLLYQWGRKDPFPNIDDADIGGTGALALTRLRKTYNAENKEIAMTNDGNTFSATSWAFMTSATIPYAQIARYPMTFGYSSKTTNWIDEARDDLWGNPYSNEIGDIGEKSIYDPCPPGYRVPHRYMGTRFTATGANVKGVTNENWLGQYNTAADIQNNGGNIYPFGSGKAEYSAAGMLFASSGKIVPFRTGKYVGAYHVSMPTSGATKSYRFYFDYANTNPNDNNARYIGSSIRCMRISK